MTRARRSLTARGLAFAVSLITVLGVGACATTPPASSAADWAMIAGTRPARVEATPPAEPATRDLHNDAATLVSDPVPAETTALGQLPDVFERIRMGYQLPDSTDPSIARLVKFFAGKPEFLDRTFERGERYLYYVVRELEARNMPLELALLPVIESAYNPYAYSRARAAGVWQFIAPTAKRYEVRVNWWQDGRRDIVDSTRAALDYLSSLHTMFGGDWFLAIAAYNCGELAVQRAVDRARAAGAPTDFWHLKLPGETRGYVPSLLAMARIVANPDAYGLEFAPIANKPYFTQVDVRGQLDLRVAATLLRVSEDELHALNPAFNRWATDPEGPHHLLVPYAAAPEFARTIAELPHEARMPVERYRITKNDSIQTLARDRAIPVSTIRQLNGLSAVDFRVGDDIILPASKIAPLRAGLIIEGETSLKNDRRHRHSYVVRRGDTLASIAKRNHVGVQELVRLNGLAPHSRLHAGHRLVVAASDQDAKPTGKRAKHPSAKESGPRKVSYVVRHGDTLGTISKRFSVSIAQVKTWNRIKGSGLRPGQKLVIYPPSEQDYGG